ncbi:hypothetical protein LARI1_G002533 [Lachnellula arida]|uniref:Uncharacterized protein n=1 Tax=Lachnellula arida TaxID=1316785 RepID=A0A8T9BRD1_9HELO|nr:hypothetical protein LARI1_G002533 [Lachnellula arida]
MPDLELQMRPGHGSLPGTASSPATLDVKLLQGDRFRESKEKLETSLKSIEAFYASPQAPRHAGPPDCGRCNTKKRRVAEAYYECYLSDASGRWDSNLPEYREEMRRKFSQPEGPQLEEIHALFQSTFREYLKQILLAPKATDNSDINSYKIIAADLLEQGKATNEVLEYYHTSQLNSCNQSTASIIRALNDSKTPRERAQIYISFYCTPSSTDTPQQKNIKQKYARLFEQLIPHDDVIAAWHKEAAASQESKVADLRGRLQELQMGQSAHLKDKARKAANAQRREPSPRVVSCQREGCPLDVNISGVEELIECAVCEWLERNGGRGGRFYYCSFEHCEEDGEEHENREHQCCMGNRCTSYPEAGPNEADGAQMCGLCPDCRDHDVVSYFCSADCYRENVATHRDEFHHRRDIPNTGAPFDRFQAAMDVEIVS